MQWIIKENKNIERLTRVCGGNSILAAVLYNRGIDTPEKIQNFIKPSSKNFRDITEMKDVLKGFELLKYALDNHEKIGICGDYDVDGVTSTSILYKAISYLGGDVIYHLPHRVKEGYGINIETVEDFYNNGCKLIITCDNGIAASAEMLYAREKGLKTLILDHHEPPCIIENGSKTEIIPVADAVIDAKQKDCPYEFKEMCAGGLCYRFVKGFYKYINADFKLERELVVLASLATVCDIVDLRDENRLIALLGLTLVNSDCRNKGLKKLIEAAMDNKKVTEHSYGFVLGPCINAAGRLDTAQDAVELLLSDDDEKISLLADKLYTLNCERKDLTEQGFEASMEYIEKNNMLDDKVLVIYIEEMSESVAGIVAGRIKERLFRPTIVLAGKNEIVKGSARSIEGYNIFEALSEQRHLLAKFGGHSMAAGLSVDKELINELRFSLNQSCTLTDEDLIPKEEVDKILDFSEISVSRIDELNILHPFGKGNPEPLFVSENVTVESVSIVGKNKDCVRFSFCDNSNIKINGIFFRGVDKLFSVLEEKNLHDIANKLQNGIKPSQTFKLDILYNLQVNEFNGSRSSQLTIRDLR